MSNTEKVESILAGYKDDEIVYQKVQSTKQQEAIPLPQLDNSRESSPLFLFKLDQESRDKAHQALEKNNIIDIDIAGDKVPQAVSMQTMFSGGKYSDEKVTPQVVCTLVDWLCENYEFMYIKEMAIYIYVDGYYQLFSYSYATRFLVKIFRKHGIDYAFRSSDYKELVRLIQMQPQIERTQEECRTNTNIILFSDGAFDVELEKMRKPQEVDYQFSRINYSLDWDNMARPSRGARDFIDRFCNNNKNLEKYLWELIGYLLSGYQRKILVMFLGPSNSGKSTLANMVRRICGSETCVALGIKELSGNFNLAELQGK